MHAAGEVIEDRAFTMGHAKNDILLCDDDVEKKKIVSIADLLTSEVHSSQPSTSQEGDLMTATE